MRQALDDAHHALTRMEAMNAALINTGAFDEEGGEAASDDYQHAVSRLIAAPALDAGELARCAALALQYERLTGRDGRGLWENKLATLVLERMAGHANR